MKIWKNRCQTNGKVSISQLEFMLSGINQGVFKIIEKKIKVRG